MSVDFTQYCINVHTIHAHNTTKSFGKIWGQSPERLQLKPNNVHTIKTTLNLYIIYSLPLVTLLKLYKPYMMISKLGSVIDIIEFFHNISIIFTFRNFNTLFKQSMYIPCMYDILYILKVFSKIHPISLSISYMKI